MEIIEYDSFTTEKGKGNPAAVAYLGEKTIDDKSMQQIAKAIGFNETVFVSAFNDTYRFRYFTPGHEVDLCGHATIAAVGFLHDGKVLPSRHLKVTTNIGEISISVGFDSFSNPLVAMQQGDSSFREFHGSTSRLCQVLGIFPQDIDESLPIVYGSTGIWTLLVPIKKIETFSRFHPESEAFPGVLEEMPKASIHPYCIEQLSNENLVYARHFSSPYSQTIEDPVTGTASGVIGEFLLRQNPDKESVEFVVNQGKEIGRPGKVFVSAKKGKRVTISGNYAKGDLLSLDHSTYLSTP